MNPRCESSPNRVLQRCPSTARWRAAGWAAGSRLATATTDAPAPMRTASGVRRSAATSRCASCRLEQAVWDETRAVLEDPERWPPSTGAGSPTRENPGGAAAADLDRRVAALRRGIGRLIDGYGLGADRARRVRAPRRGDETTPVPPRERAAGGRRERRGRAGPDAARRPPGGVRPHGSQRPRGAGLERHARGHPSHGPAGRGRRGPRQRRLPRAAPIAARERWPPPRSNPATRPWSARLSRPS